METISTHEGIIETKRSRYSCMEIRSGYCPYLKPSISGGFTAIDKTGWSNFKNIEDNLECISNLLKFKNYNVRVTIEIETRKEFLRRQRDKMCLVCWDKVGDSWRTDAPCICGRRYWATKNGARR